MLQLCLPVLPALLPTTHSLTIPCLRQFNNMLLYCIPKVIQVGAQFQVRTRIDVAGMKVRGTLFPDSAGLLLEAGIEYGEWQQGLPGSQPRNPNLEILG